MRIAQIATCSGPVREDRTGSIESLVWLLTRELTARGHEVTVFGCAGSESPGELVITQPGPYGKAGTPSDWQLCDWITIAEAIARCDHFDLIHSHAYLWGVPLERFSTAPMLHTMHTMPYEDEAKLWDRFPEARIVGLSSYQWRSATSRQPAAIIPNGVDPAHFTFNPRPGDYLCFLGRFIPNKGPLEAIAAARRIGLPLVLAGPASPYFERDVRPLIDGDQIRYVGEVNRRQRDQLLGGARALLYPLREPEPFGLVQIEAMMCGTPVVAPAIGAIPEIVQDGLSGTFAASASDLSDAIHRALNLDRVLVRQYAQSRFTAAQMASSYEGLYEALIDSAAPRRLARS